MEKVFSVIKQSLNNPRVQLALTIALICLMYFITLNTVPFHPDEATNIYMSDDLEITLKNPLSVSYLQGQEIDLKTHYRLMDPPVPRIYFGAVNLLTNTPEITTDWNWALSWDENVEDSNLPPQRTILIFRIALLLFFPLICYFIYSMTKSMLSHWAGIITIVLFAINPLILLHFRHVMTEAILLFFISFLLMLFVDGKKHLFFVPVIFSMAINSKQTAIFLLPAYGIYLLWCVVKSEKKDWLKYFASYLLIPFVITFLLNPVAWSHPIQTIQAGVEERNALIQGNEYFLQQGQPDLLEKNVAEKLLIVIYHSAYEPLALDDFPKYREKQQSSFDAYLLNPLHNHSRNIVMGTLYTISVISALGLQGMQFWRERKNRPQKHITWIFIHAGFFGSLIGLSMLSSIYQRYVVILIPYISLYIGWFIFSFIQKLKRQPE